MNVLINGSNREKNCYHVLKDIMTEQDELISLSHKDIKYCLGCDTCSNKLDKYCILNDYMTESIYPKLRNADKIIIASPLYMSGITGLLKNVIDRLNPFYHHSYFEGKELYLILIGQGTYKENEEEINDIIKYFNGISDWMNFKFIFLKYLTSGSTSELDDVRQVEPNYLEVITNIKNRLSKVETEIKIPKSVLEYGFDFDWDEREVWKLDYPTQEISVEELSWHFDTPFWNWNNEWYVLKPKDVMENPNKYRKQYDRIMDSDLSYPIDVMENKGKLVILDGLHRLSKYQLLGKEKVKVRIIPRSEIPNILKENKNYDKQ